MNKTAAYIRSVETNPLWTKIASKMTIAEKYKLLAKKKYGGTLGITGSKRLKDRQLLKRKGKAIGGAGIIDSRYVLDPLQQYRTIAKRKTP